jgi:hypothetical protein
MVKIDSTTGVILGIILELHTLDASSDKDKMKITK